MAKKEDLIFADPISTNSELPATAKDLNSRESLLPNYIPRILEVYHSSEKRPMSNSRLLDILEECPYDIHVSARTLGRTLRTLASDGISGIHVGSAGSWYDPHDAYWTMSRPGTWGDAA